MIVVMLVIFLVAKYIAEKINLKQTAKAFYYIALAYIPIIFLSIFLFELFGQYLSINGDGKYVFLAISFLILAGIYYINSKRHDNNIVIGIASFVSVILACIFGVAIFSEEIGIFVLTLVVVSIIYNIMYQREFYFLSEKFHLYSLYALLGSVSLLILYSTIFIYITDGFTYIDVLGQLLMLYNIYTLFNVIVKNEKAFIIIYPLYLVFVVFNLTTMHDEFLYHQLYMIGTYSLVFLFEMLRYKKINTSTFIEIYVFSSLLSLLTVANGESGFDGSLDVSTCFCLTASIALLKYYVDENSRKYTPYLMLIPLIFAFVDVVNVQDVSMMYMCLVGLVYMAISYVLKENNFTKPLRIIGVVTFVLFMFYADNNIWEVLLLLGFAVLTFLFNYKGEHNIYRIISYVYTNIVFIEFLRLFSLENEEFLWLCIPFASIIICAVPYVIEKMYDKTNHVYMMVHFITSLFILVCLEVSSFSILFLFVINGLYLMHIKEHNYNENFKYVTLASFIPFLFFKDVISNETIMSVIIFLSIAYLIYCIYKKKNNMYIIASYLYLGLYDENKYLILLLFTAISFVSYLIKENKVKDLFKTVLYICPVIFFEMLFDDLELGSTMSFTITPVLIVIPIIARTVIKKYSPNYKVFEYILFGLFNLIAAANFLDQSDGITFVFILTVFVIVSYLMKIGPIFIVSLIAILVDIFILTEEFWLSLPWWLYVLVVGAVLIGFAINNELKTTKDDKKLLTKLKDNLDL